MFSVTSQCVTRCDGGEVGENETTNKRVGRQRQSRFPFCFLFFPASRASFSPLLLPHNGGRRRSRQRQRTCVRVMSRPGCFVRVFGTQLTPAHPPTPPKQTAPAPAPTPQTPPPRARAAPTRPPARPPQKGQTLMSLPLRPASPPSSTSSSCCRARAASARVRWRLSWR